MLFFFFFKQKTAYEMRISDWSSDVCSSDLKAGTEIVQRSGDELKLVYPQPGLDPAEITGWDFTHFFLQPLDSPEREASTRAAIAYALDHPQWRVSLQTHKLIGLR